MLDLVKTMPQKHLSSRGRQSSRLSMHSCSVTKAVASKITAAGQHSPTPKQHSRAIIRRRTPTINFKITLISARRLTVHVTYLPLRQWRLTSRTILEAPGLSFVPPVISTIALMAPTRRLVCQVRLVAAAHGLLIMSMPTQH